MEKPLSLARLLGYLSWESVQQGLFHRRAWVRTLTVVALCLAGAIPVGAVIGLLGALYGSALLIALAVGYLMLRSTLVGLIAVIGVICLLPFAALPVNIGFSPTLLDLALLALFFVWLSRLAAHQDGQFIAEAPTLPVLAFVALSMVSFIAGLSHSPLTANVLRHFVEILLSVLVFLLVINTIRTKAQLKLAILVLILAGFAAALIGVVLYYLPNTLTIRLLSALRVVRYPTGADVLRYIEDNPELPLRATSTSVDPNVLGGMLIFVTTITSAQALTKRPLLPRVLLIGMVGVMALCMILTYSRGSFAGMAVALVFMGLLRYRRALWVVLVLVAVLLLVPAGQAYVQRFVAGVQGEDLAMQMRFGEFKDAFILIRRYPWFGVGFAGTPDIDTYLGVSNVYLLIAEEMGVVGLLAFLVAVGRFLVGFIATMLRPVRDAELEPILLGTCLAIAGALVGGTLDHYLFNLDFPHAAALLWITVGLGTVSIRLVRESRAEASPRGPSGVPSG
jgi:O-antigen ligase